VPAVERTAGTGAPSSEQYVLDLGGEERSFEARLVRAEDGNVLSIVRDVTDRVRAEEALAESRRLVDRVATASPAILYVYDVVDNRNVYINDALSRVLGYTPDRLTAAGAVDLWALMHPDDLARWPAMGAQVAAAADGEVVEQAFRLRHADGGWRWLTQRVTVLAREPDGRPRLVVGAALDVTALRETEAALRASEARYRAVVESQTELICRWLPGSAIITFVNDANCRAIGRPREEVVGRSILDFAPASDRDRLAAYFASLTAEPRTGEEEHEAVLADWHHRPVPLGRYPRLRRGREPGRVPRGRHGRHRAAPGRGGVARKRGAVPRGRRQSDRADHPPPAGHHPHLTPTQPLPGVAGSAAGRNLLGRRILDLVAGRTADRLAPRLPPQGAAPRVREIDYETNCRRHRRLPALGRHPCCDVDGPSSRSMAIGRDVTALRRAEAALRGERGAPAAALEARAWGTWDWHVDGGVVVAWSAHARSALRLPVGTPHSRSRHRRPSSPDDAQRMPRVARRCAARSPYAASIPRRSGRTGRSGGWSQGRAVATTRPAGPPLSGSRWTPPSASGPRRRCTT
jgi:PAS domain S-box-containing protein